MDFLEMETCYKRALIVIIILGFLISISKVLGINFSEIFNFVVHKINYSRVLVIITIFILLAFLLYAFLKISSDVNKQKANNLLIAKKSSEIIYLYLKKIRDYQVDRFYLDNTTFIQKFSKALNISEDYFIENVFNHIKKENSQFNFVNYVNPSGKENGFWRLNDF